MHAFAKIGDWTPRTTLRDLTDPVHQSLHQHPVSLAIMNDGSHAALRLFLKAQLSLLGLVAHTAHGPGVLDAKRLRLALEADIEEPIQRLPMRHDKMINRAACAGMTYVFLGSLMGRKSILSSMRMISSAPFPDRFLTAEMPVRWWRQTLSALEAQSHNDTDWDAVEIGALMAFEHVRDCLDTSVLVSGHPKVA